MFLIAETLVDRAIPEARFCCDLAVCKGACCSLEGGRGAPLDEAETREIDAAFPIVRRYLSPEHLSTIEKFGLYEGPPGSRATVCVGEKACVFAFFEDGIARCSFERAYTNGEIKWRKPISCHLFPIRVSRLGTDVLRYEMIDECAAGRSKGKQEGIPMVKFLEDPLVRRFGRNWYDTFLQKTGNHATQDLKS
jgi:hypothetical protein